MLWKEEIKICNLTILQDYRSAFIYVGIFTIWQFGGLQHSILQDARRLRYHHKVGRLFKVPKFWLKMFG
jgi:hypothetical protein